VNTELVELHTQRAIDDVKDAMRAIVEGAWLIPSCRTPAAASARAEVRRVSAYRRRTSVGVEGQRQRRLYGPSGVNSTGWVMTISCSRVCP
jgi:hypothetical protein